MLPLLQESFPIDIVLAHGSGFPGKVGTAGVALEQERLPRLVPATDQETHSEWSDSTRLGVLLHHLPHPVHQLRRGDVLVVHEEVVLRHLPGSPHQESVVWSHATVHHANVAGDLLDLNKYLFQY